MIATEWRELKSPDFEQMRALLKQPLVFDGRDLFDPVLVRGLGIEYYGIGRGEGVQQASADGDNGRIEINEWG